METILISIIGMLIIIIWVMLYVFWEHIIKLNKKFSNYEEQCNRENNAAQRQYYRYDEKIDKLRTENYWLYAKNTDLKVEIAKQIRLKKKYYKLLNS